MPQRQRVVERGEFGTLLSPKIREKRKGLVENCKKQIKALGAIRYSNRERSAHGVGELVVDGVDRLEFGIN